MFDDMMKLLKKNKRKESKKLYMEFFTRVIDYKAREEQEQKTTKSQVSVLSGSLWVMLSFVSILIFFKSFVNMTDNWFSIRYW